MTEYGGGGDPTVSMQLLWGAAPEPTRGPKRGLDLGRIVAAAIALADAEGLPALSMRKVAEKLGVGTMSLYRYVPGKAELLDLMLDAVHGEANRLADESGAAGSSPSTQRGWRERLIEVARRAWGLYLRHPWVLQVAMSRPPLGPNVLDTYERDLAAVEGIGLSDVEMDSVVALIAGFVQSAARAQIDVTLAEQRTGMTDLQWWEAHAPLLERVFDAERYPLGARVGASAGEAHNAAYDPRYAFDFGLARILDGIQVMLER